MKDKKIDNSDNKIEEINVAGAQEKIIPKFCTTINVGLLKSKNIILTMSYSEGLTSVVLIDRIIIDIEHAKQLKDVLDKLLKECEDV
jgi:hypothetical protein